jgi:hypothetical protein
MRYLTDNKDTAKCFEKWANGCQLHFSSYFFWVNDNKIQRSQEGLLRAILFEIFRNNPKLVSLMLSSIQLLTCIEHTEYGPYHWRFDELFNMFSTTMMRSQNTHKYAIFIDGLDEYEGDHTQLIKFLQDLKAFDNIKLCVASRPWNAFEAAFGTHEQTKIYMQNLTQNDIRIYVKGELEDREDFKKLKKSELSDANAISDEIIAKAQGVFLWVRLVVRSLQEGLQNADRVSDLRRRLNAFPSDLNEFFDYILRSLDPIYRTQMVKGFHFALEAPEALALMHFWYIDTEEDNPEYAINMKVLTSSDSDALRILELEREGVMSTRINGRFKGLLEVTQLEKSDYNSSYHSNQKTVDFLHRTLRDFLRTSDCQRMLAEWTPSDFSAHQGLCNAYLADLKTCWARPNNLTLNMLSAETLLRYIFAAAEKHEEHKNSALRAEFQALHSIFRHPKGMLSSIINSDPTIVRDSSSLMRLAIKVGGSGYVTEILSTMPSEMSLIFKSECLRIAFENNQSKVLQILVQARPHAYLYPPVSDWTRSNLDDRLEIQMLEDLCRFYAVRRKDLSAIQMKDNFRLTNAELRHLKKLIPNGQAEPREPWSIRCHRFITGNWFLMGTALVAFLAAFLALYDLLTLSLKLFS